MSNKLRAAVVGATGMVGQRFVTLLENHPYFQLTAVVASPRSAGVPYHEAVEGRWKMSTPIPAEARDMIVMDSNDIEAINVPWAEGEVAGAPWGSKSSKINYNHKGD